jgi:hypothetical protein
MRYGQKRMRHRAMTVAASSSRICSDGADDLPVELT